MAGDNSEPAEPVVSNDTGVSALRQARKRPAVLKAELARLRSQYTDGPILIFEGPDDIFVFSQWIKRLRSDLVYAHMPTNGKGQLLGLRSLLLGDKAGLSEKVYFFVDRDFDDLRDQEPGADVFMTDCYSVENYLVSEVVLEEVLKQVFHCQTHLELRRKILDCFSSSYSDFLDQTREVNRLIFLARKARIEIKQLDDRVGKLAVVSLGATTPGHLTAAQIVQMNEEISVELEHELAEAFAALDPPKRFRGKYAYAFFRRWLDILISENGKPNRGVFSALTSREQFRSSELTLTNFASHAPFPEGFQNFVSQI